jgi:hypothetical protein
MKAIEMTRDELKELLKHLPEHLKDKLFHMVKPDSGIEVVKKFVDDYEDDDMRDHIMAHAVSNLIRGIYKVSRAVVKDRKKEGKKGLNTIEMGYLVIECLKKEAENIKQALDDHEQDCENKHDCGAKECHE